MGGGILFIEAATMGGEPGLTLTGQLGDVMKESAEIARSFVRSHREELGLGDGTGVDIDKARVHLHVPAGATPKDGPSAGVTMTTALVSLLTGRPVKSTLGMTGEVTLQGKVLPIGGVRQKVLAAHRAGLTEVILPARNEVDLDDVPAAVREQLTIPHGERRPRGPGAGPQLISTGQERVPRGWGNPAAGHVPRLPDASGSGPTGVSAGQSVDAGPQPALRWTPIRNPLDAHPSSRP